MPGIGDLIAKYFPSDAVDTAKRVAMAESSNRFWKTNSNTNGTQDHGLFQINDANVPKLKEAGIISSSRDLYNSDTNVRAAAYLHSQQGFKPWKSSQSKWGSEVSTDDLIKQYNSASQVSTDDLIKQYNSVLGKKTASPPPLEASTEPSFFEHPLDWLGNRLTSAAQNLKARDEAMYRGLTSNNTADRKAAINVGMEQALAFAPLSMEAVGAPKLADLIKPLAKRVYASALKPSTTLTQASREKALETGLREGIPVSGSGLEKSKKIITDLNDAIRQKISAHASEGVTIPRSSGSKALYDLAGKEIETNPLPDASVNIIGNVEKQWSQQPKNIPIEQAQVFKQTINRELNDFYKAYNTGKTVPPKAWAKARQALGDALREELSTAIPEIKSLNQREGNLIEFNKQLQRAVNRMNNNNVLGLIKSVAMSGNFGTLKGFLLDTVLNNPRITSRLATAMYKGGVTPQAIKQALVLGGVKTNEQPQQPNIDEFLNQRFNQ